MSTTPTADAYRAECAERGVLPLPAVLRTYLRRDAEAQAQGGAR